MSVASLQSTVQTLTVARDKLEAEWASDKQAWRRHQAALEKEAEHMVAQIHDMRTENKQLQVRPHVRAWIWFWFASLACDDDWVRGMALGVFQLKLDKSQKFVGDMNAQHTRMQVHSVATVALSLVLVCGTLGVDSTVPPSASTPLHTFHFNSILPHPLHPPPLAASPQGEFKQFNGMMDTARAEVVALERQLAEARAETADVRTQLRRARQLGEDAAEREKSRQGAIERAEETMAGSAVLRAELRRCREEKEDLHRQVGVVKVQLQEAQQGAHRQRAEVCVCVWVGGFALGVRNTPTSPLPLCFVSHSAHT